MVCGLYGQSGLLMRLKASGCCSKKMPHGKVLSHSPGESGAYYSHQRGWFASTWLRISHSWWMNGIGTHWYRSLISDFRWLGVVWREWAWRWFPALCRRYAVTSSSAVPERPRDALCLSVVSFNSVIPPLQSFIYVTSASDLPLRTIKCCSVVFGVTLRLLVINTSSSSPVKNKRPRLAVTIVSVTNLLRSSAAVCITLGSTYCKQYVSDADKVKSTYNHFTATFWVRRFILVRRLPL